MSSEETCQCIDDGRCIACESLRLGITKTKGLDKGTDNFTVDKYGGLSYSSL